MKLEEFIAALQELARDEKWLQEKSREEIESLWDALKQALEAVVTAWHQHI